MRQVTISEVRKDFSKYLQLAESEDIVMLTKEGAPVGILKGFPSQEDWEEYFIENDPLFLQNISAARKRLQEGKGVPLESIPE